MCTWKLEIRIENKKRNVTFSVGQYNNSCSYDLCLYALHIQHFYLFMLMKCHGVDSLIISILQISNLSHESLVTSQM